MFHSSLFSFEFLEGDFEVNFFAIGLEVGMDDGESGALRKMLLDGLMVLSQVGERGQNLIVKMIVTVV